MNEDRLTFLSKRLMKTKEKQIAVSNSLKQTGDCDDTSGFTPLFELLAKLTEEEAQIYRDYADVYKPKEKPCTN